MRLRTVIPTLARSKKSVRPAASKWKLVVLTAMSLSIASFGAMTRAIAQSSLRTSFRNYAHQAWRVQDGSLPGSPNATAQTKDGYLWVGTDRGLVRFDGLRFTPFSQIADAKDNPENVLSLVASSDGGLFIGTSHGLGRWHDQHFAWTAINYGRVNAMLEDSSRSLWIARTRYAGPGKQSLGSGGLCRMDDNHATCFGEQRGMPCVFGEALTQDSHGRIWLGSDPSVCVFPDSPGGIISPATAQGGTYASFGVAAIVSTPNGAMVGFGKAGVGLGLQHLSEDGKWTSYRSGTFDGSDIAVTSILRDSRGVDWIGSDGNGIYRIDGQSVDHYGASDGLSGDAVTSINEDHEGNVWITTSNGLDRFRRLKVVTLTVQDGLPSDKVYSVLSTSKGELLVGGVGGLSILSGDRLVRVALKKRFPGFRVTSMYTGEDGRTFVGIDTGIFELTKSGLMPVGSNGEEDLGLVLQILEDKQKQLWIITTGKTHKLFKLVAGRFEEVSVPGKRVFESMAPDPQEGIWLDMSGPSVVRIKASGSETVVNTPDQFRFGYFSLAQDGTLWGVGPNGLIRYLDGKWSKLDSHNGLPCDDLNASAGDHGGSTWLYLSCGLFRIPSSELDALKLGGRPPSKGVLIGAADGAHYTSSPFSPRAEVTADGKIWFAGDGMLEMVDAKNFDVNPIKPPVHIEAVWADHKALSLVKTLSAPPHTRELQVDYTGLSLGLPELMQFRYRLQGFEGEWHEAGVRRQAFYMNLPPGHYVFQVIGANASGVWNDVGASVPVNILPTFYQTIWFRVLIGCMLGCALWLVFTYRVHRAATLIKERLAARYTERMRIARDLHDTLIQGVGALTVNVHAIMETVTGNEQAKENMDDVLDRADTLLAEGRDRIRDLRSEIEHDTDLNADLSQYISTNYPDARSLVEIAVLGDAIPLSSIVREEAVWIAKEALSNAIRHSGGSQIIVGVDFEPNAFSVAITDDGSGLETEILDSGSRYGHWGLPGMRERATAIGGRLTTRNLEPHGTEVRLTVPASVAYRKDSKQKPWYLFWKF